MSRNIKYIVVHCTGTHPYENLANIFAKWDAKELSGLPPYHYLVEPDGGVTKLLKRKHTTGGNFPCNERCIHVAYVGGIGRKGKPTNTMDEKQEDALHNLLLELCRIYDPVKIISARDLKGSPRTRAWFDVKKWLKGYDRDIMEGPSIEDADKEFYPEFSMDDFFESCEFLEEAA